MIYILVLLVVGILILVEIYGTRAALDHLSFSGETDLILAEPGQQITLSSTVENRGKLPVPFIRLQIPFPVDTRFYSESGWGRRHLKEGFRSHFLEEKLSLRKMQRSTRTIRFSLSHRGVYTVGPYRLSAGDFLGFKENFKSGDGMEIVVMPEHAKNPAVLKTFGGFLGNISVQRFLLEDPILTAGFRDYTGSDPMKNISWKRTAMTGSLQVKQFDHTAEQTATVLLDTASGSPEELEACFSLTRTICEQLERRKIPFDFRTNGDLTGPTGKLFHLPEGLGQTHLNNLLYALGRADHLNYFSKEQLVRRAVDHSKNNGFCIVITPNLDGAQVFQQLNRIGAFCIFDGRSELT